MDSMLDNMAGFWGVFSGFGVDEREGGREGFGEADGSDTALGRCVSTLVLGLWERGFWKVRVGREGWARGVLEEKGIWWVVGCEVWGLRGRGRAWCWDLDVWGSKEAGA